MKLIHLFLNIEIYTKIKKKKEIRNCKNIA